MLVTNDNYFVIQGWMRTELDLSGNELLVYAIIYGFSQDNSSKFIGSRQYLADWCGCSVRTIQNVLNNLVTKGYLKRNEISGDCCEYSTIRPDTKGCEKIAQGGVQNLHRGCAKISPNNYSNTKYSNKNNKLLSNDNNNYSTKNEEETEFESKMYQPTKKKGKSLYQKCAEYIDEYTDVLDIKLKLIEYLKFRLSIKEKPLYSIAQWKSMLNKLDKAVEECKKGYVEVIQQSLDKAWLSFYPITKKTNYNKDTFAEGNSVSCQHTDTTEEERKEMLEKQGKRVEF